MHSFHFHQEKFMHSWEKTAPENQRWWKFSPVCIQKIRDVFWLIIKKYILNILKKPKTPVSTLYIRNSTVFSIWRLRRIFFWEKNCIHFAAYWTKKRCTKNRRNFYIHSMCNILIRKRCCTIYPSGKDSSLKLQKPFRVEQRLLYSMNRLLHWRNVRLIRYFRS